MELVNLQKSIEQKCLLEDNKINVITFKRGLIYFPVVAALTQLKVVFTESGRYIFDGMESMICLGNFKERCVEFFAGQAGVPCQPTFVFVPEKNTWFLLTEGNVLFYNNPEEAYKEWIGILNDDNLNDFTEISWPK